MNSEIQQHKYKITLIGEQAVGKSSITRKYTKNEFSANILGTTGLEILKKDLIINNDKIVVTIYDSAGHERFRKIAESHYKGSNGLIFVYDITETKSFEIVTEWLKNVFLENNEIEILLIGNKIDLSDNRLISKNEGLELANNFNVGFMETSAKTGENIQESFAYIIEKIHKKRIEKDNKDNQQTFNINNKNPSNDIHNNANIPKGTDNQVTIKLDQVKKKKKGCCA